MRCPVFDPCQLSRRGRSSCRLVTSHRSADILRVSAITRVGVPASHIFVKVAVQTSTLIFAIRIRHPEGDDPLRRVEITVPSARSPMVNVFAVSASIYAFEVVPHPVDSHLSEARVHLDRRRPNGGMPEMKPEHVETLIPPVPAAGPSVVLHPRRLLPNWLTPDGP